ncbi:MAG TPA: DUF1549 domain-containing protein [Gemmataceae bacterium]|nr:DUF1549 domain-containing protein [Gemmataceae bacterium]
MLTRVAFVSMLGLSLGGWVSAAEPASNGLSLTPKTFVLRGQTAQQRLLVTRTDKGRAIDLSRKAAFRCDPPHVARVSLDGIVTPLADGTASITALLDGMQAKATVQVIDGGKLPPVTFERDVIPILTRAGCNSGACHGKARGQNGFALSLLSYDADFDYHAIVSEARGRRIFAAAPEFSLFLRKPAAQLPHGGGKRLDPGSAGYDMLRRWIVAGLPRTPKDTPSLTRISIEPSERILAANAEQQLVITAHFSNGATRDVTHLATFQSNESPIVAVNADGLMKTGPLPGEAAVMARFMEKFVVCNVSIPLAGEVPAELYAKLPRANFIDGHVWNKLQRLGITPSEPASDATFLRRAYLDVIGRLPAPAEVRAFLADTSADKRRKLVDHLLERPEYADYWANKWADLLRPNPYRVGVKAVYNLDAWLRDAFRKNKPYDQFVREIVTAKGSTFRNGAAVLFRDRREPDEITTIVSQLFMGVRLDCARCHHHPFEVWGQEDFYSLAAYFARIGRKGVGLSPPISGGEEIVFAGNRGEVKHPVTGKILAPRPLGGSPAPIDEDRDPREVLADWITSDDNPYFARVIVNRVWADLMGRGLVEPVDDLRATNPPSNGPLLTALAAEFRQQKYDLKKLIRTIMTSYVYGLSSTPNKRNLADTRNYSRHYRQRLRAEVLLDAVSDITQMPETFAAAPPGSRAMELWTVRTQSVFLDSFGRPDPNQDPPCERTSDTTVVQALHLMNAPNLQRKVTADTGRAAALVKSKKAPKEIVDGLYLLVYGRLPLAEEKADCVKLFDEKDTTRRQTTEDLLWALLNTPEFIFKD